MNRKQNKEFIQFMSVKGWIYIPQETWRRGLWLYLECLNTNQKYISKCDEESPVCFFELRETSYYFMLEIIKKLREVRN